MKLIFYSCSCENVVVDKTQYLEQVATFNGTLKDSASIINPIITVEFNNKDKKKLVVEDNNIPIIANNMYIVYSISDLVKRVNYVYIEDFNRYYYIDDIISISRDLWEISMSVDVLMSYKDIILQQKALVARNEFEFDDMLIDNQVPSELKYIPYIVLYDKFYSVINYTDRDDIERTYRYEWDLNDSSYILVGMSKTFPVTELENDNYYTPTITKNNVVFTISNEDDFDEVITELIDTTYGTALGSFWTNPSEYISSLYQSPIDLKKAQDDINGYIGVEYSMGVLNTKGLQLGLSFNNNELDCYVVTRANRLRLISRINVKYENAFKVNSFLDVNPYCKYYLFLPFLGWVNVESERIVRECYKYIIYDIDVTNGDFIATLSTHEPDKFEPVGMSLDVWKGNLYINLPIGHTNKVELMRNATQRTANYAKDLINSVGSYASKMSIGRDMNRITGNPTTLGARQTMLGRQQGANLGQGIFNSTADYLIDAVTNFVPSGSVSGLSETILTYRLGFSPMMIKMQSKYFYPEDYNHLYGKPLMQTKILNELSGYTEVASVHFNGFKTATSVELNEIETLLLSGVILP